MVDAQDRVLLLCFRVPDCGHVIWITPGGGINPGEELETALRRELKEEIGLDPEAVVGPVWIRRHRFQWGSVTYDQSETYYLCRVEAHELDSSGMEPHEILEDHRWWPLQELTESGVLTSPRRLAALLQDLLAGGPPAVPVDTGV